MMIADFLRDRGVWYRRHLHEPTGSASRRARSLGRPGMSVAKVTAIWDGRRPWLAVLPASHRIQVDRLSAILDGRPVRLIEEHHLERLFGDCQLGARPPFGQLYGIQSLIDLSLGQTSTILVSGNLCHESFEIRYRDYLALERPLPSRFAGPDAVSTRRRAG